MKFKVGDKVTLTANPRVRRNGRFENIGYREGAKLILRTPFTIAKLGNIGWTIKYKDSYVLKDKNGNLIPEFFYEKDIFPYKEYEDDTREICIVAEGRKVKAITTHNGERLVAEARCHKEDKFDLAIGAQLAIERLQKKINEFRVGDKVKVIKPDCIYTTYKDWFKEIKDQDISIRYQYDRDISDDIKPNSVYTIVAKKEHRWRDEGMLYAIADNLTERVYLIAERGIEKL